MAVRYNVRSRSLVDIVEAMKSGKLILAPHFQRKLVWREGHKVDFIKTILLGFPFPEVFFSRGRIDVADMTSTSSVVDGQQRLTTIREFVENKIAVDNRLYSDLEPKEKEEFLKYEIAVIELDLADNDRTIVEIFKRLNRTFYALSIIEKQATEYASSEFMLTAKLLAGEFRVASESMEIELDEERSDRIERDPNISEEFLLWCEKQNVQPFHKWLLESKTFNSYQVARMVHLSHTLVVMSTFLHGIFQRNDRVKTDLENLAEVFERRDEITVRCVNSAKLIERSRPTAFWRRKANAFTLIVAADEAIRRDTVPSPDQFKDNLREFADSAPSEYLAAAREAVNNRKERVFRHKCVCQRVFGFDPSIV